MARATSLMTRPWPSRPRAELKLLPVACRVEFKSGFAEWSAGTKPKMKAVKNESPSVKASTRGSSPIWSSRGMLPGFNLTRRSRLLQASVRPAAPPMSARMKLSASNCRIMRDRLAPNAARIDISFWRVSPRASKRFATLAQAMSSTNPTAPNNTSNARRTLPTIES